MLSDFQNKILNFKNYKTIDSLIDGLDVDNLTFNLTYFDSTKQRTIKSSTTSKLDSSYVLFRLYLEEKYPELVDYFEEVNSKNSFNGLNETDEEFEIRLNSIKEIKKTFFRIYNKIKMYKGTKSFFDFIIRFYLKMKYSFSEYEIEINIYETGAFSYLITANLDSADWEYIIKPIVHPNGWGATFVSINQFSDKTYFQDRIMNIQKNLNFNMIDSCRFEEAEFQRNFLPEQNVITQRQNSTIYSFGDWVYPEVYNGRIFYCSMAGQSNSTIPSWDELDEEETIVDGGVTWKCYFLKNKMYSPIIVQSNESAYLRDFDETLPYFFTNGYLENKDDQPFYCEFNIADGTLLLTNDFEIEFSEKVDPNLVNSCVEVKINSVVTPVIFESIEKSGIDETKKQYRRYKMTTYNNDSSYEVTVKKEMFSMVTHKYLVRDFTITFTGEVPEYYFAGELAIDL